MALTQLIRSSCKLNAMRTLITPVNHFNTVSGMARISETQLMMPKTTINKVSPAPKPITAAAVQISNQIRNISVSAPKYSSVNGTHSTLWTVERGLSAGLLALLPAAIIWPCQPLDAMLAVSIVMHSHWGLEAIVVDYVRAVLFGSFIPKLAHGLLILFSAATLAGLFYFIYNDIGLGRAVRKIWSVKSE